MRRLTPIKLYIALALAIACFFVGCTVGRFTGGNHAEVPTAESVDLEGLPGVETRPRFLSYWEAAYQPYLEQAAKETGYDVRAVNCDTDSLGRTGYVMIIAYDARVELGPFWKRYYELVAEAEEVIRQ